MKKYFPWNHHFQLLQLLESILTNSQKRKKITGFLLSVHISRAIYNVVETQEEGRSLDVNQITELAPAWCLTEIKYI